MKVIRKEIPQWQFDINAKIQEKRKLAHEKRFEDERKIVNDRLTEFLGIYFDNYQIDDEDSNTATFDTLNDEWKELCQKWKILFKSLVLDVEAFSKSITLNLNDEKMKEVLGQMKAENKAKVSEMDAKI